MAGNVPTSCGLGSQREGVRVSGIFLAAGQATVVKAITIEEDFVIAFKQINIITVPIRYKVFNISTNAMAIAQSNNLLEALLLLTLPGVGNHFRHNLVILGLSGHTACILKRVRDLLKASWILT